MVTELGMVPVVEDLGESSEKVTETCIGPDFQIAFKFLLDLEWLSNMCTELTFI